MHTDNDGLYVKVSELKRLELEDPVAARIVLSHASRLVCKYDIEPQVHERGFWMNPLLFSQLRSLIDLAHSRIPPEAQRYQNIWDATN